MEKVTKKMVWCGAGPYGVGWCGAMVVEIHQDEGQSEGQSSWPKRRHPELSVF